ncbi:hypothetical protein [Pedobacter sp. L105]|uniref:hypothetical protein n=1 Tax=Pedobacter sp. L105 TaxID=1641871 RepID=UPI00131BBC6B|nr:hypothetical protein [Pedobacter sp. L105]
MEIIHIFGNIYSAKYKEYPVNEFRRLFKNWTDTAYLENFFEENAKDLNTEFYKNSPIEDAIFNTIEEAYQLQQTVLSLAKSGDSKGLEDLFKPLHQEEKNSVFSNRKVYGLRSKSWLRIYALKTMDGIYMITGGAIKLTRSMQEREHTRHELIKMNWCEFFLKEQGVYDLEGFHEMNLL